MVEPRNPGTSGRLNGILEDIGAEIGFTATSALAAWFSGMNLYVPAQANESHPIAQVIGFPAYRRLVAAWGGEVLCLPQGRQADIDIRDRTIAEMLSSGLGSKSIAEKTGLSERRVLQIKIRLEETGVLPMFYGRKNQG